MEALLQTVLALLGALGGGAVIVFGFSSWLGKVWADRLMQRARAEHDHQLATLRAELERNNAHALEQYKFDLQLRAQGQIEQARSSLAAWNEGVRHEFEKQRFRAQLVTARTQEVYSRLILLVRLAEGKVAGLLGARFDPTFEDHSIEELEKVLDAAKTPGIERSQIVSLFTENREEGIRRLNKARRRLEMHQAREAHHEAKNHVVLEGIFMTREVRDLAFEALQAIWSAWVDAEMVEQAHLPTNFESFFLNTKKAADLVAQLENRMREDLLPAAVSLSHVPVAIGRLDVQIEPGRGTGEAPAPSTGFP